tara:strand:- start:40 stop:768 length:729 start_codon:yes stop_codon:yes gene_type:complete
MEIFKNVISPKIKSHVKLVNESKSQIDTIFYDIQLEFISENINSNTSIKTKKYNSQYVRTSLIGLSGKGANVVVMPDTIAFNDLDNDNKAQFFNTAHVNRITQVCNNVNIRTQLIDFLGNKRATVELVAKFLSKNNITSTSELNNSCMKDGIFSNGKSKKPSGATNQDTKKDNETVSIEQELKLESKNLALQLLTKIYPEFNKLNSKDKELVLTKLSNAKNCNTSIQDFQIDLDKEAKKLAI